MAGKANPDPEGFHSVTPHLVIRGAAKATMPIADMFWGDRHGRVTDPFGHDWAIATHEQDLTPEEIARAAARAGF